MPRHCLSDILQNEADLVREYDLHNGESSVAEPRDSKGYGLSRWLDEAVVGWDETRQTYFIQCIEEGDSLVWWQGTTYAEIPTFIELCTTVSNAFFGRVKFQFVDGIDRAIRLQGIARWFSPEKGYGFV